MTRRTLFVGLAIFTMLRMMRVGALDLSPDESYYLLWSQHLDLAYYSKGPGIALVLRGMTAIFGTSEFGVRVLSPILALVTTLLVFALARRLFDERTAIASALLLQFLPLFNVGALLMTVDPLSIASWTATLLLGWRAMNSPDDTPGAQRLAWWAATGLACGLGILCKYTNMLVLVGLLLTAILSGVQRRRHLVGLALASSVAALAMLPPLLWNASHGWVTATHMAERGALDQGAGLHPREMLEFVVVHFGTYSPLIFLGILLVLPAAIRRARSDDATRFLLAASAPILVMYSVLALHEAGEANWTAPGILTLSIVAAHEWMLRFQSSAGARVFCVAALVVGLLLSAAIVDTDLLRAAGVPLKAKSDPTTRLRGWRATANAVAKLRRDVERDADGRMLLVANHYGVASELAFYLPRAPIAAPGHPSVYVVPTERPRNQYWFWPTFTEPAAGLAGHDALFVTDRSTPPPTELTQLFARGCDALEPIPIERDGDVLRTMRPYLCRELRAPE